MTPEEIKWAMSLDTSIKPIDVILAVGLGFVLGGAIFFVVGYVARGMEEKSIRKRAALAARDTPGSPPPSA